MRVRKWRKKQINSVDYILHLERGAYENGERATVFSVKKTAHFNFPTVPTCDAVTKTIFYF